VSSSDFVHILADPNGWLLGVYRNFIAHGYDPTTSLIRRGITGKGVAPNYRIEEPSYLTTFHFDAQSIEMTATPGRSFNGRHHREMTHLDNLERHGEHWSEPLTFDDLSQLHSQVYS
jgi:hypothetical protein